MILGLTWIQQEQPQVEWNDAGTLLFPNGGRWRAGECYIEKYSNSGQSYTKKYSRYNNVIPKNMHGICIGDDRETSEEAYNTQGTHIPS